MRSSASKAFWIWWPSGPLTPKTGQITAIKPDASGTLGMRSRHTKTRRAALRLQTVSCITQSLALRRTPRARCKNGDAPAGNRNRLGCKRPFSIAQASVCGHGHKVRLRRFHPGQYCCAGTLTIGGMGANIHGEKGATRLSLGQGQ